MKSTAPESLTEKNRSFSDAIIKVIWTLFLVFLVITAITLFRPVEWRIEGIIVFDQLSLLMSTVLTLFCGIVLSYSSRYLAGHAKLSRFFINCVLFTMAGFLMVTADHILLFTAGWLGMGLCMAELIGGYTHVLEGAASRKNARKYFLLSTSLLAGGFGLLAVQANTWSISAIINAIGDESTSHLTVYIAVLLLIVAAFIQSALFPFQRWLMSSMTAPTPASALMHAGFVNAGAILLTRTAPLLFITDLLWVLVLAGGIGALVGKFSKFVQANIKQKLACSTTAQMGFMLLQCGLGFFSAAITHLILHGFYKAYLFLSSGSSVSQETPYATEEQHWSGWQLPVTIVSGLAGGVLFAYTTGKGLQLNSGLFLTLVIVLTVIHGTQDLLKQTGLSAGAKLLMLPIVIVPALLGYALIFNGISSLLSGMPMAEIPLPIASDQVIIGILYLATFITIELKLYRKSRRLYVHLLNISQPKSNTILQ
ncbi:proton-conducting transporter membrane subunit [Halalkalibaculum sp. DA384]|uniref:proton-conducting transporter transmembrane domain-containing protein n=1 Tax=Halalkalibaculum sp. DA384 TaxID=3373606 RepID=UPI0037549D4D